MALLHNTENQLEVVRILLAGMLCNRMERRGLERWKAEVRSTVRGMRTPHERNFETRDKLDMICDAVEEFAERAAALELAVWRASCLRFDPGCSSVGEALEREARRASVEGRTFDAGLYKAERRIRSGADIIVRDVVPFLEHEPVEEVVRKLRDYR